MQSLRKISDRCRTETENNLRAVAERFSVPMPTTWSDEGDVGMAKANFLSQLAVVSGLTLPAFVRLVRGQTGDDPRPNKGLFELPKPPNATLYETWRRWNDVVNSGVVPEWLSQRSQRQKCRQRNDNSIYNHLPQVWRHIRRTKRKAGT
ncbi:hypothetical protein JG688_00009552 [Phytophthora aleatoria]|uniref:Uncharacterized protein n=1 Tax=Phytophthora aleatoria TaxID=2496075 RepID=A0A8J5IX52_9STRA|nr:hypothetical protein JG688_00009552 [Phytophthora aleatoria]